MPVWRTPNVHFNYLNPSKPSEVRTVVPINWITFNPAATNKSKISDLRSTNAPTSYIW